MLTFSLLNSEDFWLIPHWVAVFLGNFAGEFKRLRKSGRRQKSSLIRKERVNKVLGRSVLYRLSKYWKFLTVY